MKILIYIYYYYIYILKQLILMVVIVKDSLNKWTGKKKTSTRLNKMTAGMSVLMTSGLMERVRGFRMPRWKKITPKMLKDRIRLKDAEDIFNEAILYPAQRRWNEYGYYDNPNPKVIVKYQKWAATKGSLRKSYVGLRKTIKKMSKEGTLFYESSFGEGQDTGIYNGILNYVEEEFEFYYKGLKTKKVWIEGYE